MQILPTAKTQFIDQNGLPLASGTVGFYFPGTLNPKNTYQDAAGTIANTNPVMLDSRGQALIWGSGVYRQIVKDASGVTIWDQITEDANAGLTGDITDKTFVAGTDFTPGTTTVFTLPGTFGSVSNLWVFFDGTYQGDDQILSLVGTTLTLAAPVPVGVQRVYVKGGTTIAIGTPNDGTVTGTSIALPLVINDTQNNMSIGAQAYTDITINRNVSTPGTTSNQNGGFIVYNNIQAGVTHHEYGIFSVLNNYGKDVDAQPVGMYSQANSLTTGASPLWAGVFEVKNTTPTGGGSPNDSVLTGIEVDVANGNPFSVTNRKIGVEVIAFGGFECNEGFAVHAANDTYANGTYGTGGWRNALIVYPNALNPSLGIGFNLESNHGTGIAISGTSQNFAINLQASAASTCGINIGPNYTTPIAISPNSKIAMNGLGNAQGISYDSVNSALNFNAASLELTGHTTYTSASAGGSGAPPSSIVGYMGVFIGGTLYKVPFYNA